MSSRFETITAPSAVTAEERRTGAERLAPRLPDRPGGTVGVLVGGATRRTPFTPDDAERLGDAVATFAARHDCAVAITTSRRTGHEQTARLRSALAHTHCVFVDGTDASASLDYAGILEVADALIVTADSIAMLSDAATTGKPIAGWRIGRGKARFERFYDSLTSTGAMRWFNGDFPRWTYPPLDAAGTIADALRQRLGLPNVAAQHK